MIDQNVSFAFTQIKPKHNSDSASPLFCCHVVLLTIRLVTRAQFSASLDTNKGISVVLPYFLCKFVFLCSSFLGWWPQRSRPSLCTFCHIQSAPNCSWPTHPHPVALPSGPADHMVPFWCLPSCTAAGWSMSLTSPQETHCSSCTMKDPEPSWRLSFKNVTVEGIFSCCLYCFQMETVD